MADRYLLESGAPDGYQLEDSSGVLLLEVADPPPPYSRKWLPTVLAAWAAAPIILWTNGFTVPETSANVPLNRAWAEVVRRQWQEPEYQAQARRFIPQEAAAAAAERVAYSRAWLTGTLEQWKPEGWSGQQQRKLVQEGAVAQADSPIPGYRPWLNTALASWAPAPVLIWQNGVLASSGVDQVSTDRPWLDTVLRAWEPPAYGVPRPKALVQVAAAQVDDPPRGLKPWLPTVHLSWQQSWDAQSTRHVVQPGAAPPEKTPYRRAWLQVLPAWEQELVPLWGGFGVQPETFESRSRQWLFTIARAWEVTWDAPQKRRLLVQPTVVAPDAPPITERAWLGKVIEAWEVPPHAAQGWPRHLVQPGAAPEQKTPYSRSWLFAVQGWSEPTWPSQTSRHLVQAQADAPPVNERPWLGQVGLAWEPNAYRPQVARHLAQGAPSDLPPFGLRSWQAALKQWEPAAWPAQGWIATVQGTLFSVARITATDASPPVTATTAETHSVASGDSPLTDLTASDS